MQFKNFVFCKPCKKRSFFIIKARHLNLGFYGALFLGPSTRESLARHGKRFLFIVREARIAATIAHLVDEASRDSQQDSALFERVCFLEIFQIDHGGTPIDFLPCVMLEKYLRGFFIGSHRASFEEAAFRLKGRQG